MNNKAVGIATIASGVVIGVSAIYAITNGVKFEDILTKFEQNKEVFHRLVKNLLELGRDFLVRIYNTIAELVKELIFKFKINLSYY